MTEGSYRAAFLSFLNAKSGIKQKYYTFLDQTKIYGEGENSH